MAESAPRYWSRLSNFSDLAGQARIIQKSASSLPFREKMLEDARQYQGLVDQKPVTG